MPRPGTSPRTSICAKSRRGRTARPINKEIQTFENQKDPGPRRSVKDATAHSHGARLFQGRALRPILGMAADRDASHADHSQYRTRRFRLWHGAVHHLHRPVGHDGVDAGGQSGPWRLRDDRRLYRLLCGAGSRIGYAVGDLSWRSSARSSSPFRWSGCSTAASTAPGTDAGADDHRHHLLHHRHRQLLLRPDPEDHSAAGSAARSRSISASAPSRRTGSSSSPAASWSRRASGS